MNDLPFTDVKVTARARTKRPIAIAAAGATFPKRQRSQPFRGWSVKAIQSPRQARREGQTRTKVRNHSRNYWSCQQFPGLVWWARAGIDVVVCCARACRMPRRPHRLSFLTRFLRVIICLCPSIPSVAPLKMDSCRNLPKSANKHEIEWERRQKFKPMSTEVVFGKIGKLH